MITTPEGKPQVQRNIGEPTGFFDANGTPILVGDFMTISHDCNCGYCDKTFRCQVMWNTKWEAYGLMTENGSFLSGMGIVSGEVVENGRA